MNNRQYIKALEKALTHLEKKSRKDIVMEIQSYIEDLGPQESLEERFGSVDELASSYLSGERTAQPITTRVINISRKVLGWIGIATLFFVIVVGVIIWWWSGDEFNYADEDSLELANSNITWQVVDWDKSIDIKINQSQATLYWHQAHSIRWNCKREITDIVRNGQLEIKRNSCLVFLPRQNVSIKASQSSLVVIRPIHNVDIETVQSELRIAEKATEYQYDMNINESKVAEFISYSGAKINISINAKQSSISHYSYK